MSGRSGSTADRGSSGNPVGEPVIGEPVIGEPVIGEPVIGEPVIGEPMIGEPMIDEHCRWVPAEPLRRYVAWYTGYRQRGIPPGRHRALPSPFLTLIVTLDEPLTMLAHPEPAQPPGEFGTLLR